MSGDGRHDLELLTELERQAYQRMRELVRDLHLPAGKRRPLTPTQTRAVAEYENARAQVPRGA